MKKTNPAEYLKEFQDLLTEGSEVEKTFIQPETLYEGSYDLKKVMLWYFKGRRFLEEIFGTNSKEYKIYESLQKDVHEKRNFDTVFSHFKSCAYWYEREFYEKRETYIEQNVYSDFLTQARQLHDKGYDLPAIIIAGAVLENAVYRLIVKAEIELPKNSGFEFMISQLQKNGIINEVKQKHLAYLYSIRSEKTHLKNIPKTKREKQDTEMMTRTIINETYDFVLTYLK